MLLPFLAFTAIYVLYQAISLPVNFAGPGSTWPRTRRASRPGARARYPDVDIYLPICGEPIEIAP